MATQADSVVDGAAGANGGAGEDFAANLAAAFNAFVGDPVYIHGLLMAVAWGFFVPLGLNTSRFKKTFGSGASSKLFGLERWFQIHRAANFIAGALTLAGWFVMLPSPRTNDSLSRMHTTAGIVLFTLFAMQPIYASLRSWKLHRVTGRVVVGLSIYTCHEGFEYAVDLSDAFQETFSDTFRLYFWSSVIAMGAIGGVLEYRRRQSEKTSGPKKTKK